MDINDVVSTEYVEFSPEQTVSELVGVLEDTDVPGVLVVDEGETLGVVTRRQLEGSHHPPDQRVGSLVWHVPRVAPFEDVREVARLMLDSNSRLLPVFEGERFVGVVTADDLLRAVEPFLVEATVAQAASDDPLVVAPETTFGTALNRMRERRIAHLPVVADGDPVGILSLADVVSVATRNVRASQGGNPPDARGGLQARGGFGAREGERDRILDLPVRDVMSSPVRTTTPDATLATAVAEMFDVGGSALPVVDDGAVAGIVTKSDVLEALTWEAEGNRAVQVYGTDLLDDVTYDEIVAMIDGFDDRDGDMSVFDAKVHLHEHDEQRRQTPLILARIRLYTDRGTFVGSGEGYGAKHAINEARDVLERRIRDEKTYGKSKKHPDAEYWEKRFGWWLGN